MYFARKHTFKHRHRYINKPAKSKTNVTKPHDFTLNVNASFKQKMSKNNGEKKNVQKQKKQKHMKRAKGMNKTNSIKISYILFIS